MNRNRDKMGLKSDFIPIFVPKKKIYVNNYLSFTYFRSGA